MCFLLDTILYLLEKFFFWGENYNLLNDSPPLSGNMSLFDVYGCQMMIKENVNILLQTYFQRSVRGGGYHESNIQRMCE